jgi:hypothetical protein
MVEKGEYVLDRTYEVRPHAQVTFAYSLAKSVHEKGWREVRALVLYEMPDKSLSVSLVRSVAQPAREPEEQMFEVFANGVLDYSPDCGQFPMAARQLQN